MKSLMYAAISCLLLNVDHTANAVVPKQEDHRKLNARSLLPKNESFTDRSTRLHVVFSPYSPYVQAVMVKTS